MGGLAGEVRFSLGEATSDIGFDSRRQLRGLVGKVAIDLFGQGAGHGLHLGRRRCAFGPGQPVAQVLGDAHHFAAHGLDAFGGLLLRSLDLLADGRQRPLDAVHPVLGLCVLQPAHHFDAIAFNLARQGLGQFFEAKRLARAFRLDPSLRRMQALVQIGERAFQVPQGVGGAALGLVEPLADLGQRIGAQHPGRSTGGGFFHRLHARAQFVDAAALPFLDLVQAAGQGADGGLDLAEAFQRAGTVLLLELAQALLALAHLFGQFVGAKGLGLAGLVLGLQPAQQAGHGLIHALDRHGGPALSRLEPRGDRIDRGAQPQPVLVGTVIGVVQPTGASAAFEDFGDMGAARQGGVGLVFLAVLHDHGVQPLAQGHARAPRQILGDLAGLRVNALYAPRRRRCAH